MTTDDILHMAREAGFHAETVFMTGHEPLYFVEPITANSFAALERFAALVAAAERDECAKVCDEAAGNLLMHRDKDGAEIAISLRDSIRARGTK